MRIHEGDLTDPRIVRFLREHLDDMHAVTPPESVHALDLAGLRAPDVTFWSMWEGDTLVGCGALKELDARTGEIKSMRTAPAVRRRGIASHMVEHLVEEAQRRGYTTLHLETGSQPEFAPARALYERYGFDYGGPFGAYVADPNSVFMTRTLSPRHPAR